MISHILNQQEKKMVKFATFIRSLFEKKRKPSLSDGAFIHVFNELDDSKRAM
jgi:hypothetical protein